jgi:hypothetical protein
VYAKEINFDASERIASDAEGNGDS